MNKISIWIIFVMMSTLSFGKGFPVSADLGENSIVHGIKAFAGNDSSFIKLSQEIMYAARLGENTDSLTRIISLLNSKELQTALDTDEKKMAFWINMYNAYTQVMLKADSNLYKKRGKFFKKRAINIGGHFYSLDDIEHGILRRSAVKWSGGYFKKLFKSEREKAERVGRTDYRIHFALNCGAKSCPPIAFYEPENINRQLSLAERAYLSSEVIYDSTANILYLPAIMSWFRNDFGGKKKMVSLIKKLGIIKADANPVVRFKEYDWTLYLNHYQ